MVRVAPDEDTTPEPTICSSSFAETKPEPPPISLDEPENRSTDSMIVDLDSEANTALWTLARTYNGDENHRLTTENVLLNGLASIFQARLSRLRLAGIDWGVKTTLVRDLRSYRNCELEPKLKFPKQSVMMVAINLSLKGYNITNISRNDCTISICAQPQTQTRGQNSMSFQIGESSIKKIIDSMTDAMKEYCMTYRDFNGIQETSPGSKKYFSTPDDSHYCFDFKTKDHHYVIYPAFKRTEQIYDIFLRYTMPIQTITTLYQINPLKDTIKLLHPTAQHMISMMKYGIDNLHNVPYLMDMPEQAVLAIYRDQNWNTDNFIDQSFFMIWKACWDKLREMINSDENNRTLCAQLSVVCLHYLYDGNVQSEELLLEELRKKSLM